MITFMSWNMNQRPEAWERLGSLVDDNDVAAAMLQEAKNPRSLPDAWLSNPLATADERDEHWRITVPPNYRDTEGALKPTKRWCASAVVSTRQHAVPRIPTPLNEAVDGELACSHPGQFAVSDLDVGDEKVTLISLYGLWDTMIDSGQIYAEASLHRAISDLTLLFQQRSSKLVLIAGDLNLYSYSDGSKWGDRWMTVLARLATYGFEICGPFRPDGEPRLEGCPCPDPDCRHVNTFLFQRKTTNKPHQLDFFLASPALRERLVTSWADRDPEWMTHSDHRPIFASFDL